MILLALGANLPSRYGRPEDTIVAALSKLDEVGVRVLRSSRVWRSAPVPAVEGQPWYCNAVALVQTSLRPDGLMALLHAIEQDFGRIRTGERNEPRLLDLDILSYNEVVVDDGELVLPHPRLHERAFVLYPLMDVAPGWRHPLMELTVMEMLEQLPADQIVSPLQVAAA